MPPPYRARSSAPAASSSAPPPSPAAAGCPRAPPCCPSAPGPSTRPGRGDRLTATGDPGARDLVRHALMDLGGNGNRVRSWAKAARRWPSGAHPDLLDAYAGMDFPVLLLWADQDATHPLAIAEEALDPLPHAQLRVLPRTGFLI